MKEIGILEIHCHVKYLYTICKICKTKNTNVTIFTTKDLSIRLEKYLENIKDYNLVLKNENEGIQKYLKRVEKICNEKIDLLLINTLQRTCFYMPRYFGFKPKSKTILTLHTINAWLKPKPIFNIKKIIKTIDTNISSIIAKNIILPKFDAINVIYPPIKDYIIKNTTYNKKIFTLPFGLFIDTNTKKETNRKKIQFVIPGQIEELRRDYDIVIDAFEKIFQKHNKDLELILLGYPVGTYGNKIIKRCKELQNKGYNIKYFKEFVPEKTYDETMKTIDYLLLPVKINTWGMGLVPEKYGLTKGSAAVFEGIQYAKPMIIPKNFNMIKELKSSTIKYKNSKELVTIVQDLIKKEKIKNLKKEAYNNSQKFSLQLLQDYFTKEILENIDNI